LSIGCHIQQFKKIAASTPSEDFWRNTIEDWVPNRDDIVTLSANDTRSEPWHGRVARVGALMDGKVHLGIVGYGWTYAAKGEIVIHGQAEKMG
jgi:hypothetical protein